MGRYEHIWACTWIDPRGGGRAREWRHPSQPRNTPALPPLSSTPAEATLVFHDSYAVCTDIAVKHEKSDWGSTTEIYQQRPGPRGADRAPVGARGQRLRQAGRLAGRGGGGLRGVGIQFSPVCRLAARHCSPSSGTPFLLETARGRVSAL